MQDTLRRPDTLIDMALEQKLSLRLSQRLVMTPSLQQAIKLLQMTRLELEGALTQELIENPVLEEREDDSDEESKDEESKDEASKELTAEERLAGKDAETAAEEAPAEDDFSAMSDIDLDSYFRDYWESSSTPRSYEEREAIPIENRVTHEEDLYDHLLWQLQLSDADPPIREIGELIVGNLDTDGFLKASCEEIVAMGEAEHSGAYRFEDVEAALRLVQSFDPAGIACQSLQESLLHQLDAEGEDPESLAYRTVQDHWNLFLRRQFPALARSFGVPLAEMEPVVETIRRLETHPGRRFGNERAHYVEPDVVLLRVGDEWVIQLNDDGLPRLRISRRYRDFLLQWRNDKSQTEARQYLREKMRSALWLIKCLDQRQRTIYKVADSIVRQQKEFLNRGIDYLRPMVLRDVADDIGMHESTVSRVVSNKYIHTPRGLFPMKFFFHSGIDREYGDDISSLTVKRKIQKLIGAEEPKRPLSDSELMRILNREGIHIARRTVAKYRDELAIPSSTDRKQIF